jgi:hypothetical protein
MFSPDKITARCLFGIGIAIFLTVIQGPLAEGKHNVGMSAVHTVTRVCLLEKQLEALLFGTTSYLEHFNEVNV